MKNLDEILLEIIGSPWGMVILAVISLSMLVSIGRTIINILCPFAQEKQAIPEQTEMDEEDEAEEEENYPELAALDRKLLGVPAVAMGEVERAIATMTKAARDTIVLSLAQFETYDAKNSEICCLCGRQDCIPGGSDSGGG